MLARNAHQGRRVREESDRNEHGDTAAQEINPIPHIPPDEVMCLVAAVDRLAEAVEDLNGLLREQREWQAVIPTERGSQLGFRFRVPV